MNRTMAVLSALLVGFALRASAIAPDAAQKLVKEVTPSLVAVQYTYDGELGRRDFVGAGLVVGEDGTVITSITFTPQLLPDVQMKDFKIIIPGDDLTEIDATFVGRDERSNLTFIRANPSKDKKPSVHWKPVKFEDVPVNVGDEILSVGMLGKTASYQSYFTRSLVSANLRGETRHVLVTPEGLAAVGSPVFNGDGKAIGWVTMQAGQVITLNDPNPQNQLQGVYAPPRMFVPTREFSISLKDPPVAGQPLKLPWLGVAEMSGLKKEVAEYFGLTGQVAVQVGDVIKDTPADKAGIKAGNVIVKLNGKPLERGDEPEEAAMILMKQVRNMKVGQEVTLSIIDEPNKAPTDIKVKLAERPKQENQAKRFYDEKMGFTAREIVFQDTYRRKLPADQKGVVIALVKPAGAAQAGKLERGDLITKLNQPPVTDIDQFKKVYQEFRKEKPREAVVLEAVRGGNDEIIRLEPPQ
jgi:S1-C subfamily serine protease